MPGLDALRVFFDPSGLSFARPLLIPALGLLIAAVIARAALRRPPALGWPALAEARTAGGAALDVHRGLALLLRAAAAVALALAIAGPAAENPVEPVTHSGLDLVLALDTSGSMRALDTQLAGSWQQRLDLAQEVVERFALHRVATGDRVGLVVFGDVAFTLCPLTSDGALLSAALGRVRAGMAGEATALGDALALGVKRAAAGEASRAERPGAPAEGRIVVLLTDGRSNAGAVPLDTARALAAATGTRVHTVGIGGGGEVAMAARQGEGRELEFERHDLDEEALRAVAVSSGGRYFHADDAGDLTAVYDEIDELERIPREAPPRDERAPRPEPFLATAGVLLLIEIASRRVAGRPLP